MPIVTYSTEHRATVKLVSATRGIARPQLHNWRDNDQVLSAYSTKFHFNMCHGQLKVTFELFIMESSIAYNCMLPLKLCQYKSGVSKTHNEDAACLVKLLPRPRLGYSLPTTLWQV